MPGHVELIRRYDSIDQTARLMCGFAKQSLTLLVDPQFLLDQDRWSTRTWAFEQRPVLSFLRSGLQRRLVIPIKWAAHLPYAAATALLKEVLPLETSISASGARHRIRTAGDEIDVRVEQEVARLPFLGDAEHPRESPQVTAVSVDSAWLKHCQPSRDYGQQVNIVTGRATLANGTTRVYAYVGKRV